LSRKIFVILTVILLLTSISIAGAAPSGSISFEGQVDSEDFVLQLGQSRKNAVIFKNTASATRGYEFVKWETEGDVSVSDSGSQTTTVTVNGDGTLRAIYKAGSTTHI